MTTDLAQFAQQKSVKYFLVNFTDLAGMQRSKLVPTQAIAGMQKDGAGFAGFAAGLDMTPAHPDMFSLPDASSVIQLPWKPEVAWVAGDLMMEGKAVEQAPRVVLKRQVEKAAAAGCRMKSGVECEYFLVNADGTGLSDPSDIAAQPCYDQQALMRRYDVVSEICDAMIDLGWGPYQNDHEDGNGQFEMNWDYADALVTADRHAFFKFMVRSIAEKHGLRATFMPKPFANLTGNGCHAHVSVWDKSGEKCIFDDPTGELGISETGYHFLGGVLHHAEALTAITNPTVNSYKRINAPRTTSGATWSPNTVTYGGNNRTHMVRIPDPGRFEFRLADGATNPYLLQAVYLASGMRGMANKLDCGKRLDIDMYAEGHKVTDAKKLPLNLLDAIRCFEQDGELHEALGSEFSNAYVKIKHAEWTSYCQHLTQWERDTTLDC
ncbi:MAG: glutamine synthetase type III [Hyphomicrobiaceae bacterium]|jgi:glutamine synthetase type III